MHIMFTSTAFLYTGRIFRGKAAEGGKRPSSARERVMLCLCRHLKSSFILSVPEQEFTVWKAQCSSWKPNHFVSWTAKPPTNFILQLLINKHVENRGEIFSCLTGFGGEKNLLPAEMLDWDMNSYKAVAEGNICSLYQSVDGMDAYKQGITKKEVTG